MYDASVRTASDSKRCVGDADGEIIVPMMENHIRV